jgi:hypothetical protein
LLCVEEDALLVKAKPTESIDVIEDAIISPATATVFSQPEY